MPGILPTLEDLHPDDRDGCPVRDDGVLDLAQPAGIAALIQTIARHVGLGHGPAELRVLSLLWPSVGVYGVRADGERAGVTFTRRHGAGGEIVDGLERLPREVGRAARHAAVHIWRHVRERPQICSRLRELVEAGEVERVEMGWYRAVNLGEPPEGT